MGWPVTFGTAVSPEALSNLDLMFNQSAAQFSIPCSAVGANAISLTPLTNCPALTSYNELGGYRFVAAANSTAAVTLQYNGLGLLPVYHADGVTQANTGDLVSGQQYIATFHQALNSGGGGFFLESPSFPNVTSPWYQPGGRITIVSATPVMFSTTTGATILYYAPYVHQFVPIYNGTNVQLYNFCSSLTDQVGLSLTMTPASTWPVNNAFDIYVTLVGGIPTLATVGWSGVSTRAITLAVFGGFLTNSGSTGAQTGIGGAITLQKNQGTYLGTFLTAGANGQTQWQFGGIASGGQQATFFIDNYYNKVLFTTQNQDSGASYTYTSATVRQARASSQNQVQIMSGSSERAILSQFQYTYLTASVAGAQQNCGIGINSTTSYFSTNSFEAQVVGTEVSRGQSVVSFSITGLVTISANESSDGSNANTFDPNSNNYLATQAWL